MPKKKQRSRFHHYMSGPTIAPVELPRGMGVPELVQRLGGTGFNARRLAEACELYEHMLKEGVTVGLTLSGAMTPIGMGGVLSSLMQAGFVDWIISTGANVYHDLHHAFAFPVKQGHFEMDDNELYAAGIARIYDVFIGERETLMATDQVILDAFEGRSFERGLSTADMHRVIAEHVERVAPHPERSFLVQATRLGVPVYTSSPGDSSIGMNLVIPWLQGQAVPVDPIRDVVETAAIVRDGRRNGVVEVGGGSPKNFYLQTQPTLWQILDDSRGGHDYFIQITTDSPQWGGLSGATPSEARSWGKVKDARRNNVVVYSCASLALPVLAAYVLERCQPREPRRLLDGKDASVERLRKRYLRKLAKQTRKRAGKRASGSARKRS